MEKRINGSVRILFIKCSNNIEYLMWFHSFFVKIGYCNNNKPNLYKFIAKGNKVLFIYSFTTYSFFNYTWLYYMFYNTTNTGLPVKIISRNLDKYLTPLALATWFLSSSRKELGKKTKYNKLFYFSLEDLKYLSMILKNKYNIESIIKFKIVDINGYKYNEGSIYIENSSISTFSKVIKPYVLPSLYYKLNESCIKLNLYGNYDINSYATQLKSSKINFSTSGARPISNIKTTVKYKTEYQLSLEQKEAIIGVILGDGHLERIKLSHNTRLRIDQSYPEKEKYLMHLYNLFEPMVNKLPTITTRKADKRTGKVYQSMNFKTLAMPVLNQYHDLFYKNKVKIIPRNLDQLLTARGLAFWIMDDGGISVYKQTILHTRAYTYDDVNYIQSVLLKNFSLVTRLEEKKKGQWVIYIPIKQKISLKLIVGPYMIESMWYKINT